MGDAKPRKGGRMGGDSECVKLSWDRGDWGKVKGREAYVSLFRLMFLYAYISTISIVDSALSVHSVRLWFESRSSQNIRNYLTTVHFMIQRSFVIDPKYFLTLLLTKNFLKKKQNNFRPKRVKIGNHLIKNITSWWTKSCWKAEWKAKSRKTRREYHNLVLAGHAVKRGEC